MTNLTTKMKSQPTLRARKITLVNTTLLILMILVLFHHSQHSKLQQHTIPFPKSQYKPRIAFLNRKSLLHSYLKNFEGHQGTGDDFKYVMNELGLEYSELDPMLMGPWGPKKEKADKYNTFKLGEFFCKTFDMVVTADTVPDVRFLLQKIDAQRDGKSTCGVKKLVMITTNRFDYAVPDTSKYYSLLKRVSTRNDTEIVWVANNPFEPVYANFKMGSNILNYTLIRPVGHSSLPKARNYTETFRKKVAIINYPQIAHFRRVLLQNNIPFYLLPHKYGGPTALNQFRAFVTLPYQTSTMKMYENLAHGVVTLVPSPKYLNELMNNNIPKKYDFGMLEPAKMISPSNWFEYIEFYSPELKHLFKTFDSPHHLMKILEVLEKGEIREKQIVEWNKIKHDAISKWRKILFPKIPKY